MCWCLGIMSFHIDKYRNVYTKYQKFPYQKLTGRNTMLYTGKIITGVKGIPDGYDNKKDYYFSCECHYPEWREIIKV